MILSGVYRKPLIVVAVLGIILGLGYGYAQSKYTPIAVIPEDPIAVVPVRTTLKGEYTCLPHRDTSGPQTMECALGLKMAEGVYYALDTSLLSAQVPPAIQTGDSLEANGLLTPVEMLRRDHWQKYNIEGIFSVTDGLKIEAK